MSVIVILLVSPDIWTEGEPKGKNAIKVYIKKKQTEVIVSLLVLKPTSIIL